MKKANENDVQVKGKKAANDVTELVFILDKSGSMAGLESDTIGGFNSMIKKQKGEAGKAYVTTVLFDNESVTVHDRLPLDEVPEMTDKEYVPGGCTALLDAVGQTIIHVKNVHRYIRAEDVPQKTIFVITTDGYENASREFDKKKVKALIEEQKKEGWEFLFLGANIDAVAAASNLGIEKERAVTYTCDKKGTALNFKAVGGALKAMRCKAAVPDNWKEEIEEDHARRG